MKRYQYVPTHPARGPKGSTLYKSFNQITAEEIQAFLGQINGVSLETIHVNEKIIFLNAAIHLQEEKLLKALLDAGICPPQTYTNTAEWGVTHPLSVAAGKSGFADCWIDGLFMLLDYFQCSAGGLRAVEIAIAKQRSGDSIPASEFWKQLSSGMTQEQRVTLGAKYPDTLSKPQPTEARQRVIKRDEQKREIPPSATSRYDSFAGRSTHSVSSVKPQASEEQKYGGTTYARVFASSSSRQEPKRTASTSASASDGPGPRTLADFFPTQKKEKEKGKKGKKGKKEHTPFDLTKI